MIPSKIPLTYILKQPLNGKHPLLRITDSICGHNCMQTILNDPNLADTRQPFQQDCPPSLL